MANHFSKKNIYHALSTRYSFSKKYLDKLHMIFWGYFYHLFVNEHDFYNYVCRWQAEGNGVSFRKFMDLETNQE